MEKFEIIIPCLFGMEAFVVKELKKLGYETSSVEDGRVCFEGDWTAVARANMWLRTGERVLVKVAEFTALSFEELFEATKKAPWGDIIPGDAQFPVKGYCLKSQLASMRDCQAIIKKAVATALSEKYGIEWLEESGAVYQIQFSVLKDRVTLMIDTSGDGLHKRGYRKQANLAPLKETIAAAMVYLSYWKFEEVLADPFCGSGTIPIEAAMFKRNIAPGLTRQFAGESFAQYDNTVWQQVREEAESLKRNTPLRILASDIDPDTVELAKHNAGIAGVSEGMEFSVCDATKFTCSEKNGSIITNPPYGERLGEISECEMLYSELGKTFSKLDNWAYYMIASNEEFEKHFGRRADKRRKIYNGMIKCNIYQYFSKRR